MENIVLETASTTRAPKGRIATRRKVVGWTTKDDCLLATVWLNCSKNKINGNAQKSDDYWKAVVMFFNENKKEDQAEREWNQCKQHWWTINGAVSKYIGCYSQYKDRSGFDESLKISEAHSLYEQKYASKFSYQHVWSIVRDQDKWKQENAKQKTGMGDSSKRSKVSESGDYTSSGGDIGCLDEVEEGRPIGQKASKEVAKRKAKLIQNDYSSTVSKISNTEEVRTNNLQRIVEMKEKEMALKEKEIKQQLICADVSKINLIQRKMHEKHLQAIAEKYGWNPDD